MKKNVLVLFIILMVIFTVGCSKSQSGSSSMKEKTNKKCIKMNRKMPQSDEELVKEIAASNAEVPSTGEVQNLRGYIIDTHCFVLNSKPPTETKKCLSMKLCASSGYGIAVPQKDKSYKFYYFDGEFNKNKKGTFNGTDGQAKAWNIIQNTKKKNNVSIIVTGSLDGKNGSYVDKKGVAHNYPVIKLSDLEEK